LSVSSKILAGNTGGRENTETENTRQENRILNLKVEPYDTPIQGIDVGGLTKAIMNVPWRSIQIS